MSKAQTAFETSESLADAFTSMRDEQEDYSVPATIIQQDPFSGSYITAQPCNRVRNEAAILARMKALANAKGQDYYYSWEVKNKDGTKGLIEGGTIKLADDLSAEYMNNIVDVRSIDCGDHWMIYARFADLEKGTAKIRPYRQRKTQNVGKGFAKSGDADRALDMMMQIGASKAARNVVMHALRSMWDEVLLVAKNAIVARISANPEGAKAAILDLLTKLKVDAQRAELMVGRKSPDWTVPDMAKLWSTLNSIKDGFINADDAFPKMETDEPAPKQEGNELDKMEKERKEKADKAAADKPKKGDDKKPDPTPPTGGTPASTPAPTPEPTPAPATTAIGEYNKETGEIIDNDPLGVNAEGQQPAAATPGEQPMNGTADTEYLKPLDMTLYNLNTAKGAVDAAKALIILLQTATTLEARAKLFELSFGNDLLKTLSDKGQGATAGKIRALLS